jgi:transcriptional regulator
VHLSGTLTVHTDNEWLSNAVTDLTNTHEGGRAHPWHVTDAPEPYVQGQLRGIVGIELAVTRVEGKAKLSQNRSEADRRGVVDGLRDDAANGQLKGSAGAQAQEVATSMATDLGVPEDQGGQGS